MLTCACEVDAEATTVLRPCLLHNRWAALRRGGVREEPRGCPTPGACAAVAAAVTARR